MSAASESDVLLDVFDPVANCLTPDVAQRIAELRASVSTQARLDVLAEKASNGMLTPDEAAEYRTYVTAINVLGILQAKARVVLRKCGQE